jgi:hypothetical protein
MRDRARAHPIGGAKGWPSNSYAVIGRGKRSIETGFGQGANDPMFAVAGAKASPRQAEQFLFRRLL